MVSEKVASQALGMSGTNFRAWSADIGLIASAGRYGRRTIDEPGLVGVSIGLRLMAEGLNAPTARAFAAAMLAELPRLLDDATAGAWLVASPTVDGWTSTIVHDRQEAAALATAEGRPGAVVIDVRARVSEALGIVEKAKSLAGEKADA